MSELTTPMVVRTTAELATALTDGPRAVVMTMGALHDGHLELVRRARAEAGSVGQVVVTIFVNPLQFGVGEDLDRYPRDLEGDVAKLAGVGADLVFAPAPEVLYPDGEPVVRVSAGAIGEILEGAIRPGHFDGMLTVVLKLLHLTRPTVAFFGRKDAQQLMAVRQMVRDLNVDVRIVGVPIVREPDGLALSSRNAYLTPEQRIAAVSLSAALRAGQAAAVPGACADDVTVAARRTLEGVAGVVIDYVTLVAETGQPVPPQGPAQGLLLVAARLGKTRLIDNAAIGWPSGQGEDW